jgi:hypothetical protein
MEDRMEAARMVEKLAGNLNGIKKHINVIHSYIHMIIDVSQFFELNLIR